MCPASHSGAKAGQSEGPSPEADDMPAQPQRCESLDPNEQPRRGVQSEARAKVQPKLLGDRVGRSVEAFVWSGEMPPDESERGEVGREI